MPRRHRLSLPALCSQQPGSRVRFSGSACQWQAAGHNKVQERKAASRPRHAGDFPNHTNVSVHWASCLQGLEILRLGQPGLRARITIAGRRWAGPTVRPGCGQPECQWHHDTLPVTCRPNKRCRRAKALTGKPRPQAQGCYARQASAENSERMYVSDGGLAPETRMPSRAGREAGELPSGRPLLRVESPSLGS